MKFFNNFFISKLYRDGRGSRSTSARLNGLLKLKNGTGSIPFTLLLYRRKQVVLSNINATHEVFDHTVSKITIFSCINLIKVGYIILMSYLLVQWVNQQSLVPLDSTKLRSRFWQRGVAKLQYWRSGCLTLVETQPLWLTDSFAGSILCQQVSTKKQMSFRVIKTVLSKCACHHIW